MYGFCEEREKEIANSQTLSGIAYGNWKEANKNYETTYRAMLSSESQCESQHSSLYCPEQLTLSPEEEQETRPVNIVENWIQEEKDLENLENSRLEEAVQEMTSEQWQQLLQNVTISDESPRSSPSSSSSSTEESRDLSPSRTRKRGTRNRNTRQYFSMGGRGAEKRVECLTDIQVPIGKPQVHTGLTVTMEKMSSATMISTVAGLVSTNFADSWIVTQYKLNIRGDMFNSATQLVFLQLTPCREPGTTSRNTELSD